MKHFALIAALAVTTTPALAELNLNDSCGASRYQSLIGQPAIVADLMAEANMARVLRPGAITTMIYVAERMNISINDYETIDRVYCG